MRLARFRHDGTARPGVVVGEEMVDLAAFDVELATEVAALLDPEARPALDAAVEHGSARLPLADVELLAPVPHPGTFLAIGLNYADHVAESGGEAPEFPVFFNKQVACVQDPYGPIHHPRASEMLDYEGELAFVIGRPARHVPAERAHEVIGGYLVCNDVSARDWQFRSPTMTLGKSFDTHGPIGPWVVTPDEIGDPHALELRTWVNGEQRQHSSTSQLIFDCYEQVAVLSTVTTLRPGDIVSTGTPGGVGIATGALLSIGDRVRIEIEGIGGIENEVIVEPPDTATV